MNNKDTDPVPAIYAPLADSGHKIIRGRNDWFLCTRCCYFAADLLKKLRECVPNKLSLRGSK